MSHLYESENDCELSTINNLSVGSLGDLDQCSSVRKEKKKTTRFMFSQLSRSIYFFSIVATVAPLLDKPTTVSFYPVTAPFLDQF